jgi:hypothetical protein
MPPYPPAVRPRPAALVHREEEALLAALCLSEGLRARTGYEMEELGGVFTGALSPPITPSRRSTDLFHPFLNAFDA